MTSTPAESAQALAADEPSAETLPIDLDAPTDDAASDDEVEPDDEAQPVDGSDVACRGGRPRRRSGSQERPPHPDQRPAGTR